MNSTDVQISFLVHQFVYMGSSATYCMYVRMYVCCIQAFSDDPPNLLAQHLRCLGTEWDVIPGVMYDTMEMGCDDPQNKFLSHSEGRVAVTTHCTTQGLLFHELKVSHGKMFLKPSKIKFMATPHRFDAAVIFSQ
jgi:hypothetical protein